MEENLNPEMKEKKMKKDGGTSGARSSTQRGSIKVFYLLSIYLDREEESRDESESRPTNADREFLRFLYCFFLWDIKTTN